LFGNRARKLPAACLSAIERADFLHFGVTPLMDQLDGEPASRILSFAKEYGVITTFDVLAVSMPKLIEMVNI
jgi:hypothetical protein